MAFNFGGMGMGMGYGGGGPRKSEQMDANYNFPVVALKALTAYQPRDYQFSLEERMLFDVTKVTKNIKVLNGDISEDVAKSQAKTLVDQLQSEKAHAKYHMIQQINTESDVGDVELLHAPIWFARYDHKGKKIVLVVDGNSGRLINSMGLDYQSRGQLERIQQLLTHNPHYRLTPEQTVGRSKLKRFSLSCHS